MHPIIAAPMQRLLDFRLHTQSTFRTYYPGSNALAVDSLSSVASGRAKDLQLIIWGRVQTGKTHLLQAVVQAARANGRQPMYLPLTDFVQYNPELLDRLEQFDVICIDDMDTIAGYADWERTFVQKLDFWRQSGVQVVCSLHNNPAAGDAFGLPDLNSRLTWGAVHKLKALDEAGLLAALHQHALARGMTLPDDVCDYLLSRCSRSIRDLLAGLEQIDLASIRLQKKISLTMVRKWMEDSML